MQLSLNWLKDFVKISNSITPEEVGQKLTLHTVEVEGVTKQGEKFKNIVVGKILEVKKHPNADRLRLAKVEIGKDKILDIVCGAPNIEAGQLVPVAMPGAVMANGLEIKEAEVRGEKSQGMLCAEDELGLGGDHAGILILDGKARVGQNFSDYLGVNDVVLEVDNKSLSNRPDLWSHYGIARELSVLFDAKFIERPKVDLNKDIKIKKEDKVVNLKVEVKDKELCPRYMALPISGIKIAPSPKWMQ
ncbi:MAG: phenylalanine--tRNA ligase subunit beta, partial [Patescibacteria group bacterium]|nr:phenylalanine--tRNA ligase subunit beta [Patescibacteria group bacterium]